MYGAIPYFSSTNVFFMLSVAIMEKEQYPKTLSCDTEHFCAYSVYWLSAGDSSCFVWERWSIAGQDNVASHQRHYYRQRQLKQPLQARTPPKIRADVGWSIDQTLRSSSLEWKWTNPRCPIQLLKMWTKPPNVTRIDTALSGHLQSPTLVTLMKYVYAIGCMLEVHLLLEKLWIREA